MPKSQLLGSVYPLIAASVSISALAQIALKAGMVSPPVVRALQSGGSKVLMLTQIALSPLVMLGLCLYFASAAVWLLVLSKVEVSFAYPFVAIGFVLTAVLGRLVFHDTFTLSKLIGTALIMAGVVVMSRGA